jgi:hypothetical protein
MGANANANDDGALAGMKMTRGSARRLGAQIARMQRKSGSREVTFR